MTDYPEPEGEVASVEPRELLDRLRRGDGVSLLDLRDRDEFESWRIDGPGVEATQVPYVKFVSAEATNSVGDLAAEVGLDEPVVAVCGRGEASACVADLLGDAGVEAANLAGGMEAWARLSVAREVTDYDGPGTLVQYERPSSGCLAHLLVSAGEAAVVDPLRAFADRYADDAAERGADLAYAVDTHVHADHVSGARDVAERAGAGPVVPAGARDRGLAFDAATLADGDELQVGDATLSALAAPGHTSELLTFRVGNVLLSADALFLDGVGRPDLECEARSASNGSSGDEPRDDGSEGAADLAADLYDTLHTRLDALPGDTVVAPGHASPDDQPADDGTFTARLADVRDRIDLFGLSDRAFEERVTESLGDHPANFERIIDVNLGRADADDDEAFELELGPNNCAVSRAD
jgi:glyoxylase-like metal-dependent hydrolase (beta-lactamase superfamily II)